MSYKYRQGKFKPTNPEKYVGDVKNIIYRSWLEFKFMRQLDNDPNIIHWGSEQVVVPYVSPKDRRPHRYFVDFFYITKDGQKYMVEIKPESQTKPPKRGKKKIQTFNEEVLTYGINISKWNAAEKFGKERGFKFIVITEKNLGVTYK